MLQKQTETNPQLLVATTNPGKRSEWAGLLSSMPISLADLSQFSAVTEVPETGSTFAQNAELKAIGYATQTGLLTVADDSGLEVASLNGRPGVLSARYGGAASSYEDKIQKLLREIEISGSDDRGARFVCSVVVAAPDGQVLFSAEGICPGQIAADPRGSLGFGYDPIFIPYPYDQTFGELSVNIKQKISHRSRAFAHIIPFLRDFIAILT
jgi:XTP/dITP diphosphohydrolase